MKYGLILLSLWAGLTWAEGVVRIRPQIVVAPQSEVRLSQLVDGQGLSPQFQAKLNEVVLSVAPAYGEKQELANASLTSLLRPLLEEERARAKGAVRVILPRVVIVDTVKHGWDTHLIEAELLQTWQPLCGDCRLGYSVGWSYWLRPSWKSRGRIRH